MLTDAELRKAIRRSIYKRIRLEQPSLRRQVARHMAQATERQAWTRRDSDLVHRLQAIFPMSQSAG